MNKNFFKKIFFILATIIFSTSAYTDNKMSLGMNVYNDKAECGSCHTLKAAGSKGDIGPNLDDLKPSIDQIIYVVKNGIGVMPPWEGILTKEEIEAVAYYVFTKTKK
tara:strand:+ start:21 stop:341 length:321 start_codon:yes stop_codon:yes gene_type:complete